MWKSLSCLMVAPQLVALPLHPLAPAASVSGEGRERAEGGGLRLGEGHPQPLSSSDREVGSLNVLTRTPLGTALVEPLRAPATQRILAKVYDVVLRASSTRLDRELSSRRARREDRVCLRLQQERESPQFGGSNGLPPGGCGRTHHEQ